MLEARVFFGRAKLHMCIVTSIRNEARVVVTKLLVNLAPELARMTIALHRVERLTDDVGAGLPQRCVAKISLGLTAAELRPVLRLKVHSNMRSHHTLHFYGFGCETQTGVKPTICFARVLNSLKLAPIGIPCAR